MIEWMEPIITIILAVVGSSGIASIVVAVLNHHWTKKAAGDKRIDALVEAQQVLMIDRVRYLGKCYIENGCIALADKENLNAMYNAYKALGGNGHLETVMGEVNRLEVKG